MPDFSYCSNIFIKKPNQEDQLSTQNLFQKVYSSQTYGTFFSVFAQFDIEDQSNSDEIEFLDSITLQLINYKGLMDIGFYQSDDPDNCRRRGYAIGTRPIRDDQGNTWNAIVLTLYVCARSGNLGTASEIVIPKEDLENLSLKENKLFFVERETISFGGATEQELRDMDIPARKLYFEGNVKNTGLFDDEFFYRNGNLRRFRQDTDASLLNPEHDDDYSVQDGNPSCHNLGSFIRLG